MERNFAGCRVVRPSAVPPPPSKTATAVACRLRVRWPHGRQLNAANRRHGGTNLDLGGGLQVAWRPVHAEGQPRR